MPRHLFIPPGVTPEEAYRDEVIPLLPGLATLSQPSIVALMLEELDARPGMKILEIGTASGYNAALLAEVAGDPSLVHSVEIEPRLAEQARRNLAAAGYGKVKVKVGDGCLGWPEAAPFARTMVTAEAAELSPHLLTQLDAKGILLTPFSIPGLPGLLLRLELKGSRAVGRFIGIPVSFVPLRGEYAGDGRRREAGSHLVQQAMAATEERAWEEQIDLTLECRLALCLVTAALVEQGKAPPRQVADEAWRRYVAGGKPDLNAIRVSVCPLAECPSRQLAFRRRDYALCLNLPVERNSGEGGESPQREVMS